MADMALLLGERIRYFRKTAGFSQDELATKSGIAMQYLSRLERGKTNPTVAVVAQIAGGLGVPLHVLMDFGPRPEREELLRDLCARIADMPDDVLHSLLHVTRSIKTASVPQDDE